MADLAATSRALLREGGVARRRHDRHVDHNPVEQVSSLFMLRRLRGGRHYRRPQPRPSADHVLRPRFDRLRAGGGHAPVYDTQTRVVSGSLIPRRPRRLRGRRPHRYGSATPTVSPLRAGRPQAAVRTTSFRSVHPPRRRIPVATRFLPRLREDDEEDGLRAPGGRAPPGSDDGREDWSVSLSLVLSGRNGVHVG